MNYLDLFSGIGGFALGAYWAGLRFDKHYFSEIDPWCCNLYQKRFPDAVPLGDIREIDGKALADSECMGWPARTGEAVRPEQQEAVGQNAGDFCSEGWIITGGFPCQDISVAGKGAGIEGVRSGLWFEYARLIGEIRPRYAIMENVGALTRRGLDRVLGSLAEIGYDAEWSDIRASDLGAPHRRERIWIVAYPHYHGPQGRDSEVMRERPTERAAREGGSSVPDPRRNAATRHGGSIWEAGQPSWWNAEPSLCSLVDGLPAGVGGYEGRTATHAYQRVPQLRGYGNAIMPEIAEMIFRGLA